MIMPFRLCNRRDFENMNMEKDYIDKKIKSAGDPTILKGNRFNTMCPDMDKFNEHAMV